MHISFHLRLLPKTQISIFTWSIDITGCVCQIYLPKLAWSKHQTFSSSNLPYLRCTITHLVAENENIGSVLFLLNSTNGIFLPHHLNTVFHWHCYHISPIFHCCYHINLSELLSFQADLLIPKSDDVTFFLKVIPWTPIALEYSPISIFPWEAFLLFISLLKWFLSFSSHPI